MDATFDLRILSAKILKDGYLEPEAAQMLTDAADYLDWLHEVLWLESEELSDKLNSLTLSHTEPKL